MKEFTTFSHILNTCQMSPMGDLGGKYIHPHFKNFIDAFDSLNSQINNNRRYTEKEIADYIFRIGIDRNDVTLVKDYLKRRFFVANSYLQFLDKKFDDSTIQNHFDSLNLICTDYSELLNQIYFFKVIVPKEEFEQLRWRKKTKHIFQIYNDSENFFNMLYFNTTPGVKFYDLEPYSIFAMRQLIEEMGKGILGVYRIIDTNGTPSRKSSFPWEFIEKEVKNPSPRIVVTFETSIILNIQDWSNNFIHTTATADIFTIWQALEMLKKLIKTTTEPIKNHSGYIHHPSHNIPDIKIYDYNSLREEFEQFINGKSKIPLKVDWIDYEKWGIEGCIMSL